MFHTYVLAASGTVVDFDRASFLMDRDLLQQSIDAMKHEQSTCPRSDAAYGAQWVWDDYCRRHVEQYGGQFGPDVIPQWDSPPKPEREPPSPAEYDERAIVVLTRERARSFRRLSRARQRRAKTR